MFVTLDVKVLLNSNDIADALDLADYYLEQSSDIIISHDDPRYILPVFNVAERPRNNLQMGVKWIELDTQLR
jgi:hypothetical protein